ncbi:unnamed protein product [Ambrosiozyma monospora]|uniref:Unnamed protein product n=1 Tax=Ambrosiozyma monospora TaxID=43982 RepID=A0ACB5SUV8_AMBMO|nr:unnamed protein product [Ambrosiozyma monospora]
MNPEYYQYQLNSMDFIRQTRQLSADGKLTLPTLDLSETDIVLSKEDFDDILISIGQMPGVINDEAKVDLFHLPFFKDFMLGLLKGKLRFDSNNEGKNTNEEEEFYCVGKINKIEKFLNIGSIQSLKINPSANSGMLVEHQSAKDRLDIIFKRAIQNYFKMPDQLNIHFANESDGLNLFAYLNCELMCVPISICLTLFRKFFETHMQPHDTNEIEMGVPNTETEKFITQLQILTLHCPQLDPVANLLAITKLGKKQFQMFTSRYCNLETYSYSTITNMSLSEIFSGPAMSTFPSLAAAIITDSPTLHRRHTEPSVPVVQKDTITKSKNMKTDWEQSFKENNSIEHDKKEPEERKILPDTSNSLPDNEEGVEEEQEKKEEEVDEQDGDNVGADYEEVEEEDPSPSPPPPPPSPPPPPTEKRSIEELEPENRIHKRIKSTKSETYQTSIEPNGHHRSVDNRKIARRDTESSVTSRDSTRSSTPPLSTPLSTPPKQHQQVRDYKETQQSPKRHGKLTARHEHIRKSTDLQRKPSVSFEEKSIQHTSPTFLPGECLYLETFGPIDGGTVVLLIDSASKFVAARCTTNVDNFPTIITTVLNFMATRSKKCKIKQLRLTSEILRNSEFLERYCESKNIAIKYRPIRQTEIQLLIRLLIDDTRVYVTGSKIGAHYWNCAFIHTVYTHNYKRRGSDLSPVEKFKERQFDNYRYVPYGCAAYGENIAGTFIGFDHKPNCIYLLLDGQDRVKRVTNFRLDEQYFPYREMPSSDPSLKTQSFSMLMDSSLIGVSSDDSTAFVQ